MTNKERAEFLLKGAQRTIEELNEALEKELWNWVIRRAQEAVELSLKATFKLLNVEYPKVHNVAPAFEKILKEKGIGVPSKEIEEIKQISRDLSEKRAPAFYGEEVYSKEEAILAREQAEHVLIFCKELIRKLMRP